MFQEIMGRMFLGNRIFDYFVCVLTFFIGAVAIKVFRYFLLRRLKEWSEKTETTIDDFLVKILQRVAVPLAYLIVLYFSSKALKLTQQLEGIITVVATAVLTLFAVRFILAFIDYGFKVYCKKREREMVTGNSLNGILRLIKFIVWGTAAIFFLDNLGFKVTAVITGLGIGGVAIALAAQAVLGDLFSYIAILFDRPFKEGDFIIIGDYLGVVEHIGMKTTRISSLSGEQVVFSNTDLTNSRIRNYKKMRKRRVVFKLGVTYATPLEKMKEIPAVIEKIIKNIEDAVFDRAHFFSYADFSLVFETVYYVKGGDYNKYMDIQQEINFAIKKEFEEKEIEFAFPTQTVYLNKTQVF